MSKLLSIKNLRVRFRIKSPLQAMLQKIDDQYIDAVRQVSLDIKQGETFTLVGESGSGKTTLALAVAGLLNATEGQIKFMNEDVTSMTSSQIMAYRKKISFIWQNSIGSLSPRMSVGSLITEGYKIHNLKDRDLKMPGAVEELLHMLHLKMDHLQIQYNNALHHTQDPNRYHHHMCHHLNSMAYY